MLTLEELFHSTLPEGSTVLAGAENLGVEVSWAVALRSRAPGFDGLKGGELAIVSIAAMRQLDDRLTLTRLFDQISGLGVAAVAVVGPVDTNSVAVAERLGLPLLLLPEHTSARDLETRITRAIVERRSELQRLGQDFYHQLLELVVSGHGADSVVGRLAEITGRPAFFQDPALHLLAMRFPATSPLGKKELLAMIAARSADDASRLTALTANAADPPTIRLALPGSGLARIVAPVGGAAGREGYLSVVGPSPELTAVDRLAVSRAAAACAIDLARERASRSDSDLRLAEVLDDLLAGSYPSEAALLGRAQRLGFDLTKPHLALALRAQGVDGLPATRTLERILRREFSRRSLPPVMRADPQGAVAVLPATLGREGLRSLLAVLRDGIGGLGGHLAAAYGRPSSGIPGLRDALLAASRGLEVGVQRDGPDAVLSLADLGVDELLISLGAQPVLTAFRDEWLTSLAQYDARNNTQLVATLAAYFAAHSSPTEAAERLHLHRNTMLYRLQRIREITGRDPDDPAAQLAFHLALRIDALAAAG